MPYKKTYIEKRSHSEDRARRNESIEKRSRNLFRIPMVVEEFLILFAIRLAAEPVEIIKLVSFHAMAHATAAAITHEEIHALRLVITHVKIPVKIIG